uniref:Uncharacterized protein n=1 Tax=Anguilla anguilla TaxID=7936 RepID=A0A0E9T5G9_ANGAN
MLMFTEFCHIISYIRSCIYLM